MSAKKSRQKKQERIHHLKAEITRLSIIYADLEIKRRLLQLELLSIILLISLQILWTPRRQKKAEGRKELNKIKKNLELELYISL